MDNPEIFLTTELKLRATEEYDRFIFQIIEPWVTAATQHEIKKEDLAKALALYFPKPIVTKKGTFTPAFFCPTCTEYVLRNQEYCDTCGQHLAPPEET